jgi:hypothetical protein
MLQFIGKFFGPEEILEVRDTATLTHRNVPIVEVITKREGDENKTRLITTTVVALELLATDKASEWNTFQAVKLDFVVRQLMNIATDYGVQGSELQPMLARFGMALATRFEQASHIKFEGNDDEFVPGGNEFHTWSLAKAEHVIVNSKNGTTETDK